MFSVLTKSKIVYKDLYKKIIAVAFFAAVLSIIGLASFTYADNFNLAQSTNSAVHGWKSVKYSDIYVYAISSDGGDGSVYYSGDGGISWNITGNILLDPNNTYITGISSSQNGQIVVVSTTMGIILNTNYTTASWSQMWSPYGTPFYSIAMSANGNTIIAGSSGNIFYSTDSGASWSSGSGSIGSGNVMSLSCDTTCTTIYAVTDGGLLYRSTNSGYSWSELSLPYGNIRSAAVSSDGRYIAVVGQGYIMTSSDSGANWVIHYDPGFKIWTSVAVSPDGTKMFAAASNDYPWSSIDGGNTWTQESSLSITNPTSIAFSSNGNSLVGGSSNSYIFTGHRTLVPPATPDLTASSDSGYSSSDDITNANTLTFNVNCSADGNTVRLYDSVIGDYKAGGACYGGVATITTDVSSVSNSVLYFNAEETDGVATSARSGTIAVTVDRTPPSITSISTQNITDTTAQIMINTDEVTASAVVEISEGSRSYSDTTLTTPHTISVTGLTASTQYYFTTTVTDAAGNVTYTTMNANSFVTAPTPLSGCTDSTANNYNPAATQNDGSCTYDVYGCTNSGANNYNPSATIDDGSCDFNISGCTDFTAINYNNSATIDDGSCVYPPVPVLNTPDLVSSSDTGISNTDNITGVPNPTFTVGGCTNGNSVNFFADITGLGTVACVGQNATITVATPNYFTDMVNGTYAITATQSYSGRDSSSSNPLITTVRTTGPVISQVAPNSLLANSAIIWWNTDVLANSKIEYGLITNYGNSVQDLSSYIMENHALSISGLSPNTLYHYRVISVDQAGNTSTSTDQTFETVVSAPSKPTLTAETDSGVLGDGITNQIRPHFNISSCVDGAVVELNINGVFDTSTYCVGGVVLIPTYDLPETTLDISVTQVYNGFRSDSSEVLSLTIDTEPTVQTNIYTDTLTASSAMIHIDTISNASAYIEYGTTESYGFRLDVGGTDYLAAHTFNLTNLLPSTEYHYRIVSTDVAGNQITSGDYTFITSAPENNQPTPAVNGGLPTIQVIGLPDITNNGDSFLSTMWNIIKNIITGTSTPESSNSSSSTAPTVETKPIVNTSPSANENSATSGLLGQKQVFTTDTGAPYVFSKTLSLGVSSSVGTSASSDVKKLQIFLNATGFTVSKNGAGSAGNETNTYGPATKNAVLKFQKAVGIKGANGIFGPLTRAKVNAILNNALKIK